MTSFLFKKKSKIHGIGIFSKKEIEKSSAFYVVPAKNILDKPKSRCAHIGKNRWISDKKVLNFINHSCNPNSILDTKKEPKLVAKRKIKIGEEITVDYNKTEKGGKKISCNCVEENCKKYFLRIE